MAGSVNKVTLVGNLGRDPEVRQTTDQGKIVQLNVATSESWRDKATGERRDRTEWHRVVIFNERLADVAEKYLRKGSKVYLEGQLQTRKWTDATGQERYTTEVVMSKFKGEMVLLDSRSGSEGGHAHPYENLAEGQHGPMPSLESSSRPSPKSSSASSSSDVFDDDIPF